MNNSKYYYIAVRKPNALLAKFLSKHDRERFCLNGFGTFKLTKTLNNIRFHVEITIMLNRKNFKSLK